MDDYETHVRDDDDRCEFCGEVLDDGYCWNCEDDEDYDDDDDDDYDDGDSNE